MLEYGFSISFPSASVEPPGDLKPPSEEEVACLEANTPLRSYVITVMEPELILHAAQHSHLNVKAVFNAKRRKVRL